MILIFKGKEVKVFTHTLSHTLRSLRPSFHLSFFHYFFLPSFLHPHYSYFHTYLLTSFILSPSLPPSLLFPSFLRSFLPYYHQSLAKSITCSLTNVSSHYLYLFLSIFLSIFLSNFLSIFFSLGMLDSLLSRVGEVCVHFVVMVAVPIILTHMQITNGQSVTLHAIAFFTQIISRSNFCSICNALPCYIQWVPMRQCSMLFCRSQFIVFVVLVSQSSDLLIMWSFIQSKMRHNIVQHF